MWLVIHAGITVKPGKWKGPQASLSKSLDKLVILKTFDG